MQMRGWYVSTKSVGASTAVRSQADVTDKVVQRGLARCQDRQEVWQIGQGKEVTTVSSVSTSKGSKENNKGRSTEKDGTKACQLVSNG